jgi:hypothetical protein
MQCAEKYKQWPTIEQLLLFARDRTQCRAKTLPTNIHHKCEVELLNFEPIRNSMTVEVAIEKFKKSASIAERVKLE